MDVNGSRYHLLNTEAEWRLQIGDSKTNKLQWDTLQQGVTLDERLFRFPPRRSESHLKTSDFRAADSDRYGNLYWIGADQQSLCYRSAQDMAASVYWTVADLQQSCHGKSITGGFYPRTEAPPSTPIRLSGLVITADQYLLVGSLQIGGVLIFDLYAGGMPLWIQWPTVLNLQVRDIKVGSDGRIVILDVGDGSTGARLWTMNTHFQIVGLQGGDTEQVDSLFKAQNGTAKQQSFAGSTVITEQLALQTDVMHVLAIELLADGSCLLLETGVDETQGSVLHRYFQGDKRESLSLQTGIADNALIRAHDFLFVAQAGQMNFNIQGLLYVCDNLGNQTFAFQLGLQEGQLSIQLNHQYYPMHSYSGQALVKTDKGVMYAMLKNWLPLVAQPQRRYVSQGELSALVLDSEITACMWHRLIIDACIPDDTEVMIAVRAAEQREWLLHEEFISQPALYLRHHGSELPIQSPRNTTDKSRVEKSRNGSWELLLQSPKGRFIEVRINLLGNGRSSPVLYALRLYYPRFSYLQEYLPAVYQDETESAHFLDRYLANVEGMFTEMEGRIGKIEHLFDSRSVPTDFLDWLASWIGVVFNPLWDEARRRLLLRFVLLLYRWRGTKAGLRAAISLEISPCPDERIFAELQALEANQNLKDHLAGQANGVRIVERFRLRSFSAQALGVPDNQNSPVLLNLTASWSPAQGAQALNQVYQQYLQSLSTPQHSDTDDSLFPISLPQDEDRAALWRYFLQNYLSFYYAVVDSCNAQDILRYREFLARRYQNIKTYNQRYSVEMTSFQSIFFPESLPAEQVALNDWVEFVSGIMAIKNNAHLFTVLVPAYINESTIQHRQRLAQTRTVVAREKPAHTDFDVQLYWALFRVGSARLGLDTALGESSRYVAMTLDQEYLGQSYLAAAYPFNIHDRYVTGRDRL